MNLVVKQMSDHITPNEFLSDILSRKDKPKLNLKKFIETFDFMCLMSDTDDPYVKPAMKRYAKCQKYLMNQSKSNNISFIMTCLILSNYEHDWQKTGYLYKCVEENGTLYDALPHKTIETIMGHCPVELMDSCRIEMYNRMLLVRGPNNERVPFDEYPDNHKIIAMLAVTNHIVQLDCSPDAINETELCYISSVVNPCIIIFTDAKAKEIVVKRIHGKKFDIKACKGSTQRYPYSKLGVVRAILDILAEHPTFREYTDEDLAQYANCL